MIDEKDLDPNLLNEIQKQFEFLKKEIDDDSNENMANLESLLGFSMDNLGQEMENMMKTRKIQVQKVHEDAIFPEYAYPTDSGFDLYSVDDFQLLPFKRAIVSTGLKLSFNEGYEIQVRPKSGLALKQGLTVLNTPGTVDSGYNGEVKVIVFNTNKESFTIEKGMKIAQAVLSPVACGKFVNLIKVDNVEETDRGDNGFGSTGINL